MCTINRYKFDVFEIGDRRRDSTFPETLVMHTFKHLAEALIQKRLLGNPQLVHCQFVVLCHFVRHGKD